MARRHARTCSTRCRVALHRAGRRVVRFPVELLDRARWVRHSAAKVPLRCDGAGAASSTDPRTWSSYGAAAVAMAGVGVGFVLDGDGVVCVDLDHAIVDGVVAGWAREIVDGAGDTYVEVSRSGTGLHVWGFGDVAGGRVIRDGDVAVEVYGRGRFIAMGVRWRDAPLRLANVDGLLNRLR